MPEIGEIRKGGDIGKIYPCKYIWYACPDCGKERWVQLVKGQPVSQRCFACAQIEAGRQKRGIYKGENSPRWKGGRKRASGGYIEVKIYPGDFFYPMAEKGGYVKEHRLVMAKKLGRCLQRWEIVHHKDGIEDHNEIGNLQLVQEMQHSQITIFENRIKQLEIRITQLEAENALLRGEIKDGIHTYSN